MTNEYVCAHRCQIHPTCEVFLYITEDFTGDPSYIGNCHLKWENAEMTDTVTGFKSGFKGCV